MYSISLAVSLFPISFSLRYHCPLFDTSATAFKTIITKRNLIVTHPCLITYEAKSESKFKNSGQSYSQILLYLINRLDCDLNIPFKHGYI